MLKREEIQVKILKRQSRSSGERGDKNWKSNSIIVLNQGEANVKRADILTRNGMNSSFLSRKLGSIHLINSVLIPSCVTLPSQQLGGGRRSGGFFLRSLKCFFR
jgi:hypothetical protein